jgi:hypothetical protein
MDPHVPAGPPRADRKQVRTMTGRSTLCNGLAFGGAVSEILRPLVGLVARANSLRR